MYLVDSHCHLDQLELTQQTLGMEGVMQAAKNAGVQHMLCVCITLKDFPTMLELTKQYHHVSASVGLHPNETEIEAEPTAEALVALAQDKKVVAIGETGLDYFRSVGDVEWQRNRFRQHIQAAKQVRKPLIVHTRQAQADTINILAEENAKDIGGVLHCFTEEWEMAKAALDMNFYISFSGIITFKSATQIQDVAKRVPLERMLIETDSPYLAPIPHRGKPNEPAYVRYVAEAIAELRGIPVTEIAEHTTANYFRLFGQPVV
jgi:TatD DNase family protein